MLGLEKDITEKYGIEVKSIIPFRDAFIMSTSGGKKVLRKSEFSIDRILFIHAAKEHLYNNGFDRVDRYLCTKDEEPCIEIDGSIFTVADFIEGRECNFDDRTDIINASKLLASFHKASKGFKAPEGSSSRDELGKLPSYFSKRLEEIKKLKKIARRGKTKFDYMFLEHCDYFYSLGEKSIEEIENSKYEQLVEAARSEGSFCHHDFTHHNIICSEDKISIINFDFCCFELKVYDIANFLRRKMRKCNWDINEAAVIMDEYRSIEDVKEDELYVMKVILQFPQKLWRVVNKYYNSKRSWSEKSYIVRLQEVIDEMEHHKRFIEMFEKII